MFFHTVLASFAESFYLSNKTYSSLFKSKGRSNAKALFSIGLLTALFVSVSNITSAQYSIVYNDAGSLPLQTDDVSVCQDEVFINTARVIITDDAADNIFVTVSFPPGVYYVPGCVDIIETNAGITISDFDISDLSNPVFQVSPADINALDQFTFSYCRVADCEATAYQMGGGTFKDNIEVCGDAGCVEEINPNLNSYDLTTPSISMSSEGPITASIGENVCRDVTLTNGGLGYLDSLKFYVLDGTGTTTTSVTTPGGTAITPEVNGDTLCYWLDSSIISEFGDGDGFMENGEQIMLTRCYDVDECDNDSYFGSYWGCPGKCMTTDEIMQQTNLPNLTPNLSFGFADGVNDDFCFKGQSAATGGTAVIQTFELCNTGTGGAANVSFELWNATPGSGTGQNYFTLEPGQVYDQDGNFLGTTASQTSLAAGNYRQADCSLEGHHAGVTYELGDIGIPAGECITVEIPSYANSLTIECDARCNANIAWYYFNRSFSYQDECLINNYGLPRQGIAYGGRQLYTYDIEMPTDFSDCDEFTLEVQYSNFYNDTKADGIGSTELKINVANTGMLYNGDGAETFKGVGITVTQVGDTICVIYPPDGIAIGAGVLELPMKATCSAGGGTKTINLWHEGEYDDACPGSRYHLRCLNRTFVMHCPEPCPEGGATPKNFTLERISLGLEDLNNDGIPDGTGTADPADVKLHRASNCDTVKGTWEIYVHPNTVGPNAGVPFNNLYVEFDLFDRNLNCTYYTTDNLFEPLPDAVATIYPAGGGSTTCTVNAEIIGDIAKYDLSDCKATWEAGDSVVFCAEYVVTTGIHSSSFSQYVSNNEVYSSYIEDPVGDNPSPENKYTCDHYDDYMNVYQHYFSPWTPRPQNINGCSGTLAFYLRYYINVQTGDVWYPNEYRPFTIPDKFTIDIDDGFAYRPGSMRFAGQVVPDSDITQGGNMLTICNLKQFFQGYGGPLLESDETWSYGLTFQVDPTCEAEVGLSNIRFTSQVIGNGCHSPDMNFVAVTSCGNTTGYSSYGQLNYSGPQPFLTGGGTVQYTTEEACWDVILNNGDNTVDATNTWFYIDGGTNQQLYDASGAALTPDANGFFQLGTNEASSSTVYTVCAESDQCDSTIINVLSGWHCSDYPTDLSILECSDTVKLVAIPLNSEVQLNIAGEPELPMELCETQSFMLKLTSAQAAYLDDAKLSMLIPAGLTVSNVTTEYQAGSGNIEPSSTTMTGNVMVIDIEAHSGIGSGGIPGTIDALGSEDREVYIRFDINTDCDFVSGSGIVFQAFGKRPCGDPAINNGVRVRSSDLIVGGATTPYLSGVDIEMEGGEELIGCEARLVTTNIELLALGSNSTNPNDSVIITLDPGVEFVPGSLMCCSADPDNCLTLVNTTTDASGFTTLSLVFPINPIDITNPVDLCFNFEVMNADDIGCDDPGAINVQTRASAGNVSCITAPGGVCPDLQVVTGQKELEFTSEKIDISLDGEATFTCTNTGEIEYTLPITLDSLELMADEFLVVDFYCTTASNTIGAFVKSEVINGPLPAGSLVTITGSIDEGICDPNYGVTASISNPNNDGLNQCICDDFQVSSGSLDCPAVISHSKEFVSIVETGDGEWDVKWNIIVENTGLGEGSYNLIDVPGFDDDIEICGAEYTSDAPMNAGNPGPLLLVLDGMYELATDQLIDGQSTHTYCLTVCVSYDPLADPAVGDGIYTGCESGTAGDPAPGEGLYNQSQLDVDDDGVADEIDEVCADLPCALTIMSAVPTACDPETSTYDLTVTVTYTAGPDCLLDINGTTFITDGSGNETFTVTGITADGMTDVQVAAFFTCEATCFDTDSYDAPAACMTLSCETTQVDVDCNGESTGSATVTADGGFAPYTYAWSSGGTMSTESNLAAGTYTVTVTDASMLTTECEVTLTEPSAIVCNISKNNDISCNGLSDGSASVSPSGGTPGYTVLWTSGETTLTATQLGAGPNFVTITDANACELICEVSILEPSLLTCAIESFENPSCAGTATGSITVSGMGGTGELEFSIDGGAFQAGTSFTNLIAGAHSITVRDENGCTNTCDQLLTDPTPFTCSTNALANANCGMDNGSAQVAGVGGTPGYTYLWDNLETTATALSLSAGVHSVTVTDANGCETTCSVDIASTTGLMCSISSSTDVSCFEGTDGTATVAASGGTMPYTYAWSDGTTSAIVSGLTAGTYSVIVTDADDCTSECSIIIEEPTALVCEVVKENDITCNGDNDGSATVNVMGGTPNYTYEWSSMETTATAVALTPGVNMVTVTDDNGCEVTCSVTIAEPEIVECTIAGFMNPDCADAATGSITVSATGGTAPLEFSIDGGAYQPGVEFTGLVDGNHIVTVRDANGCTSTCEQILTDPPAITCSVEALENAACGMASGSAEVTAMGGISPYTYEWDNLETTAIAVALTAGVHTVTVTDANGCTTECSISIMSTSGLMCEITASNDISCNGADDGGATVSGTGGTAPYTYLWSNGTTTASISGVGGGDYAVTLTDADGCTSECGVTLNEPTELVCEVVKNNDITCFEDADGSATVSAMGGTANYTYEWSSGETATVAVALEPGTNFVTVTDANGCEAICEVVIEEPTVVACNIEAIVNPLCAGDDSGSVTVAGAGGTAPLSFSINGGTFQPGTIFTGLTAQEHTITVQDANGCESTCIATLVDPPALTCTVDLLEEAACGMADGSAIVNPVGGTGPYIYTWDNLEDTQTAIALDAGVHSVTVTDANGCVTSCSVSVSSPTGLSCEISANSDVSCNGASDGTATVTVTGGTTPYIYAWSNGTDAATLANVPGGTYTVTTTDADGCDVVCSIEINEPTALVCEVVKNNDISCFEAADGSATVSAMGGTPNYTYEWSSGETATVATALTPGTNFVTVTDANGCESICELEILEPTVVSCSIEGSTDPLCAGDDSGTITVSGSGGTAPLSFSINGGAFQPGTSFTGLLAQEHIITVLDANGCESMCSVTLIDPPALSCTVELLEEAACGMADGSALVTPVGGTGPFTYAWDNLEETQTAIALEAGVHTVTVTDANGCETTCSISVSSPSGLTCEITASTDVSCSNASDGSATVSISGGTAPYMYAWSNGTDEASITNVPGGTYTVTATDADGCDVVCSVEIMEATTLVCEVVKNSDISCFEAADGSATISAMGGIPNYTYLWSSGETSSVANALEPGANFVTVTDANGCEAICELEIIEPAVLGCNIESISNPLCAGDDSGSITVAGAGGTAPLSFSINGGAFQPGGVFTGLTAQAYTITVQDANGCESTCSTTLVDPPVLTCTVELLEEAACNMDDGSAIVTPVGGTGPYSYAWSNLEDTQTATSLGEGIQTVTVTDANGCTTSCSVNVTSPSGLTCEITASSDVTCSGASDGSATVIVEGGTMPYSYEWSNGDDTATLMNVSGGTYMVTATDADGCEAICEVLINEPIALVCEVVKNNDISCFGADDGSASVSAMGGTPNYTYEWSSGETSTVATALTPGINYVTVTDANSCEVVCEIEIIEPAELTCSLMSTPSECMGQNNGTVSTTVNGGTAPFSYSINGGASQTGAIFTDLAPGSYTVLVTDANGCSSDCSIDVGITGCEFDLALIKELTPGQANPVNPGDEVSYTITVFNQGQIPADNIVVTDYIPSGMNYLPTNATNLANLWSTSGANVETTLSVANTLLPAGGLAPNSSVQVVIILEVDQNAAQGDSIDNFAEISSATDDEGMVIDDVDSTLDDDNTNDGVPDDNTTDGSNNDEDDHDIESIEINYFDLALTKSVASGQATSVAPGDDVNYTFTVYNQGTIPADNITIIDYIPACMELNDTNWQASGDNAEYTISVANGDLDPGGLLPGESVQVNITLQVLGSADHSCDLTNAGEISNQTDDEGNPIEDQDSTPDTNNDDTIGGDDIIDGLNGDEDDHDPASIDLLMADLALIKTLSAGQSGSVAVGQDVTFDITVTNQGSIAADNITIADYLDPCMSLNDADWTGTNPAYYTISVANMDLPAGGLLPDQTVTVSITVSIDCAPESGQLENVAEIESFTDEDGNPMIDDDSTPDDDPDNDLPGEDDIDNEVIELLEFDLALAKDLADNQSSFVAPGDLVNYTFTIVNQGEIPADNILIVDHMPDCMTLADANWTEDMGMAITTLSVADGDLPVGGLAPGQSVSYDITLQLDNPIDSNCDLMNLGEIAGSTDETGYPQDDMDSTPDFSETNDVPGEDDVDVAMIQLLEFDLALSKTLATGQSSSVMPGDDVVFTFTVVNQGDIAADNIEITDYIPASFELNDPNWTGTNPASTTLSVMDGDLPAGGLAPGETAMVDITLTVLMTAIEGDTYTNVGEISSVTDTDGNPTEDIDSTPDDVENNDPPGEDDIDDVSVVIMGECDLAQIKTFNHFYSNGDGTGGQVVFDISIINQGGCTAYNVGLIDYVLPGWEVNDPNWYVSPFNGYAYMMVPGPIAPGETEVVTITLDVESFDPNDPQTNWSEIYGSEDFNGDEQEDVDSDPDFEPSNDGLPIDNEVNDFFGDEDDHDFEVIQIIDLALDKSLNPAMMGPYMYGDEIIFDICITNEGNATVNEVTVTDNIPAGFAFDASLNPTWSDTAPAVDHVFSGPFAPGDVLCESITLIFTDGGSSTEDYTNVAEITQVIDSNDEVNPDDWDSTPDNDDGDQSEDDEDSEVFEVFDLELTKTEVSSGPYAYGDEVTFEIEVCNAGSVVAQNIVVEDRFPCGFEAVPATGWSNNGSTITRTISGPLQPSDCETLSLTMTIQPCTENDAWFNVAEIVASEDTNGIGRDDIDSTEDNDVDGEDDQDNELVEIFDLAQIKQVATGEGPYVFGEYAEYTFTIYNQGNVGASNIEITDYLPSGLAFDDSYIHPTGSTPSANADWTLDNTTGYISRTIMTDGNQLSPGESISLTVYLEVVEADQIEDWYNFSEISNATDSEGNPVQDADSTSDADPSNDDDPLDENDYTDDAINSEDGDEDDHDGAIILVTGEVGDTVWKDTDGDGIQDADEVGVAGVEVHLFDCEGNYISSTTTDANGNYLFDLLFPGEYMINFDISGLDEACDFTLQNQSDDDTLDSDANLAGDTECFTINAGDMIHDIDAGLIPLAGLGDYVWHDVNGNGVQDAGEEGIGSVRVDLFDDSGVLIGTTYTDSNGYYEFINLYPGDYYVKFTAPNGYDITFAHEGGNDTHDSDVDNSNGSGTTQMINLEPGEFDESIDAGYYICVPIGDLVWYDTNQNDVADNFENGINGIKVEIYRLSNGSYEFWGEEITGHEPGTPSDDGYWKACVPPGTYYLKMITSATGLIEVSANVGSDEDIDSDVTGTNGVGTTDAFTVTSGEEKCDLGAGYYALDSSDDPVMSQSNQNGFSVSTPDNQLAGQKETSIVANTSLYPNPAQSQCTVELELEDSVEQVGMRVFDSRGQLVIDPVILDNYAEPGIHKYLVDVANLPAGMYKVEVRIGMERVVKKLIKL